jgi:Ran GTPase-activating protein (RanGAP) involved in mRNA processing and transport
LESMSVSNDSTVLSTTDNRRALLSSTFLEFCVKVRNNDPSIMPELGEPFKIRPLNEGASIELTDALLENTSVRYLELGTDKYTKSSAEAMAKFLRSSKQLQHIRWSQRFMVGARELRHCEFILCSFLPAIQESTSLKKLDIQLPLSGGPSSLAFENMLTQNQNLRSLTLRCPSGLQEDIANMATTLSGLKRNTTLRELTLDFMQGATAVPSILTSLRDHPLLRRLCLRGHVADLTGLEAVLRSDKSKISELEIRESYDGDPPLGLTQVLQALGRHPALTKLSLIDLGIGRDEARLLRTILCNNPSLESLDLARNVLGSAWLAELAQRCTATRRLKC